MRNYPNLRKEPKSWRLFVLSLLPRYARTTPCEPKVFLLLWVHVSSSSAVVQASAPWIVDQLPTASSITVLEPIYWAPDGTDSSSRSGKWRGQSCMKIYTGSRRTHRRSARPPNVGSTSTLRLVLVLILIRVNCGFCLRLLSVGTSAFDLCVPYPKSNSASQYAYDDWQRPTSIVDLTAREPYRFFTFAKYVSF